MFVQVFLIWNSLDEMHHFVLYSRCTIVSCSRYTVLCSRYTIVLYSRYIVLCSRYAIVLCSRSMLFSFRALLSSLYNLYSERYYRMWVIKYLMEFRTIYFKGDILTKFLDVKGSFELPPISQEGSWGVLARMVYWCWLSFSFGFVLGSRSFQVSILY